MEDSQCQYICTSTAETKRPAKYKAFEAQMDDFPRRQAVKMPKIIEVYDFIILLLILCKLSFSNISLNIPLALTL